MHLLSEWQRLDNFSSGQANIGLGLIYTNDDDDAVIRIVDISI